MRVPLILGAATLSAALLLGNARSAPAAAAVPSAAPETAQATPARPPAFATCAICHKTGAKEVSAMGPNLYRVGGRKAGSAAYAYSPAMKGSKIVWNKANLTRFIMNPKGTVPGNKMAYPGQKDPKQAAAIADYLLRIK